MIPITSHLQQRKTIKGLMETGRLIERWCSLCDEEVMVFSDGVGPVIEDDFVSLVEFNQDGTWLTHSGYKPHRCAAGSVTPITPTDED